MMRVGINGFGRIGRVLTRVLWARGDHAVVHVNDLNPDMANFAYLLRYDSNYGRFSGTVATEGDRLALAGEGRDWTISTSVAQDAAQAPWADAGCDVLIESSGVTENFAACHNVTRAPGGPGRAIITQIAQSADGAVIRGVSGADRPAPEWRVIAGSTCDANAIAPVLDRIQQAIGIDHVFLTTIHPWLSYQNLTDGPPSAQSVPGGYISDYALGRASAGSLIPKNTTAGEAVMQAVPALRGKIQSHSYRSPTSVVGYADLGITLKRAADRLEVIDALEMLAPVFALSEEPLVSVDLVGDPHSATVDLRWLDIADGHRLRLVLAYDNEWGYSNRIADLISDLGD